MAYVRHLDEYAGVDRTWLLFARDSSNEPIDITGYTVTWYVGRSPFRPDNSTAIITKTGTLSSPSIGGFQVSVTPSDTQYLNGDYEHMAFATSGAGAVSVVTTGRMRFRPQLVP